MKRKRTNIEPSASDSRTLRQRRQDDEFEGADAEEVEAEPLLKLTGIHNGAVESRGKAKPFEETSTYNSNDNGVQATPESSRKVIFSTPSKPLQEDASNGMSTIMRNANHSARRKSARRLIERTVNGVDSEDEILDEEDTLAEQILSEEEEEEEEEEGEEVAQGYNAREDEEHPPVPETPSKRGRGRPKGKPRKQRSLTPPRDLPPHEQYFWRNRPGGIKTSNNTLSSQSLLDHDQYFKTMQSYEDHHELEKDYLLELHSRAFDQWHFEMEEGFNICLYGYGSKRPLIDMFAAHLYKHLSDRPSYKGTKKMPKIIIINGYTPGMTMKEILTTILSTIIPPHLKLPSQPASLLSYLFTHLSKNPPAHPISLLLNSIDSLPLRKAPVPSMLALVAAHPAINLISTADSPNFPLLWDVGQRAHFKFLFHDATTFAPYAAEIDVVDTVNELLGRSGRRVGGRDGVGFVLRSLPENARSLFRILVFEQMALLSLDRVTDADGVDADGMDADDGVTATPGHKTNLASRKAAQLESSQGVEYRVLYHKAVEEFVCSNEVGFRTLLKEFHDHQMVESRKDGMGTERLWVPFRREDLESLGEELIAEEI